MKKIFFILVMFLIIGSILFGQLPSIPQDPGTRSPLSTVQMKSRLVATVTADASSPASSAMSWAQCLTTFKEIPVTWNAVSLSFYGYGDGSGSGDPNGATFSYDVYVCDLYGGMEAVALNNTGAIGEQELSHDYENTALNSGAVNSSYKWADTLAEGTRYWSTAMLYSNNGGNSNRAKVKFDRQESYGIWVRIYNMTAQPVTSITCIMNGY